MKEVKLVASLKGLCGELTCCEDTVLPPLLLWCVLRFLMVL